MPRQDVPYGGAICRLKERIAEIWDKLGEKLHSINGVEGDAAGNVEIVSGDAAVVITSDQVNHQITVELDQTELPAAAVSSVNGQIGAVVLDANDIDAGLTPAGTSVAQDLAITKQQLQTAGGLLQQEILDRQNADAALQNNINAALATIPGEVSSQIANDQTIALLVNADSQNVKLTGNQDISGVKTVPTAATGSATKQIANGEKVQNDLNNYAPMIRNTGNQNKSGVMTFLTGYTGSAYPVCDKTPENVGDKYLQLFKFLKQSSMIELTIKTSSEWMNAIMDVRTSLVTIHTEKHGNDRLSNTDIVVMADATSYYVYLRYPQNRKVFIELSTYAPLFANGTENLTNLDFTFFSRTLVDEPQIGDVYTNKYISQAI